jgi:drug/metabolite transporter (DMT)-like permease
LLFGLIGFSSLSFGDALVKSMAGEWPGTAIALLRYIYGTVAIGAFILWRSGWKGFRVKRYDLQLLRGVAVSISSVSFFFAVQLMPLATATSILFTNPVWVAMLSPWLLNEKASRAAALSTFLALIGVAIVLRPNLLELGPAALLPLLGAFGMAGLVILNRKSIGTASVLAMQFWIAAMAVPILVVVTLAGHISGIPQLHITQPAPIVLLKVLGVATTGTIAHWLIFIATERASAPVVAPTTYVQLLVAGALGWFLFGQHIDVVSACGMAVIILAGVLLWRSQKPKIVPIPPD